MLELDLRAIFLFTGLASALCLSGPGALMAKPAQLHLSTESDPRTSITAAFKLNWESSELRCRLGTLPGFYDEWVQPRISPAPNEDSSWVYSASFENLSPGTRYYYQCGGDRVGWSLERSFRTALAGPDGEFVLTYWGDQGTSDAARGLVSHVATYVKPDLHIHAGDLAYANGNPARWDDWFEIIAPLASTTPYMTVQGNHDLEGELEDSTYLGRLALPGNECWYSFRWNGVHFTMLDTQKYFTPGSDQVDWILADLASAAADPTVRWMVLVCHKPPYSAGPIHGSVPELRLVIGNLCDSYGVDLALTAHEHTYERTYPILGERVTDHCDDCVDPEGTVYLVSGGASPSQHKAQREYWTATSGNALHFTKVEFEAGRTLHISAAGIRNSGVPSRLDRASITWNSGRRELDAVEAPEGYSVADSYGLVGGVIRAFRWPSEGNQHLRDLFRAHGQEVMGILSENAPAPGERPQGGAGLEEALVGALRPDAGPELLRALECLDGAPMPGESQASLVENSS